MAAQPADAKCRKQVRTAKSYPNTFTCGKKCPEGQIYCTPCAKTSDNVVERDTCHRCGSELGRRSS